MKSMTGYGKASFVDENFELQIELKSVNHKSFDFKILSYKELLFLENDIKDLVFQHMKRGKIDMRIHFRDKQMPLIEVDENRLKAYHDMLTKIKNTLSLRDEIKLENILSEPDVVVIKKSDYDESRFKSLFFDCLSKAIAQHQEMAQKEGKAMKTFFTDSFKLIEDNLTAIKNSVPTHREKLKESLLSTVRQILNGDYSPDMEKRILLETALYLDRCDITEEIVRIESHLTNARRYLNSTSPEVGKSMNFVLQEMQREANTISAKYTTTTTFNHVLSLKEEIERCREQVQNVE